MLVRDHENVRAQGRALAKSLSITPTPPKELALADAHLEAMRSLKNAKGSLVRPMPRHPRFAAALRSFTVETGRER